MVRLLVRRTGRLYPPLAGDISGILFSKRGIRPQEISAAATIESMRNPIDPIVNRKGSLPACSVVPQPSAPAGTPDTINLLKAYTYIYVNTQQFLFNTTLFCAWRHVSAAHTAIFRPAYNRTGPFMCAQYGIPHCLHI